MVTIKNLLMWVQGLLHVFLENYLKITIPFVVFFGLSTISLLFLTFRSHQIANFFLGTVFWPYYMFFCILILRQNAKIFVSMSSKCFKKILYLWITSFLTLLLVGIGVIALVIPGLVLAILCSMSLIAIIDKDMSPIEAIQHSVQITKPVFAELFIFYVYVILSAILLQGDFRLSVFSGESFPMFGSILYLIWMFLVGPFNMVLYAATYNKISIMPKENSINNNNNDGCLVQKPI